MCETTTLIILVVLVFIICVVAVAMLLVVNDLVEALIAGTPKNRDMFFSDSAPEHHGVDLLPWLTCFAYALTKLALSFHTS